jgi:hypothetical protein
MIASIFFMRAFLPFSAERAPSISVPIAESQGVKLFRGKACAAMPQKRAEWRTLHGF